jgi:hypothetical protein
MNQILIPLGIIVLMAILGQLMNWLKRVAEQKQMERNRLPANMPERSSLPPRDLSRYLRAVDAQRQKPLPTARPTPPVAVPTVAPVKRPRIADTASPAFPQAKPKPTTTPATEDLPVAVVVTPTTTPIVAPPIAHAKPKRAAPPIQKTSPVTPFARQFTTLLAGPNAAALAVALHEVLGPPKCKRS